ncbi:MAG TPA: beta-Ala-His dipeptidase [Clostridia bacterium]|nr:beta-Ala-His dipeptidase [Clostridia bacterium]
MGVLDNFEPQNLWQHFENITKLMHDSGYEDDVRKYVYDVLSSNKKVTVTYYNSNITNPSNPEDLDYVGQRVIVARKKADEGFEDKPTIVLQAHMDMVCVPKHDIFPLTLLTYQDSDVTWLKAGDLQKGKGTTLGADDGIGVATILALIEDDRFKCGEIECFFTLQEETNMGGAAGFDPNILKGKVYLNLDSEDISTIFYGSAGGALSTFTKEIKTEAFPNGYKCLTVEISGLQGGHSGVNINEERGNAICLMTRFLSETAQGGTVDFRLINFSGGTKDNAIPTECKVSVAVKATQTDDFLKLLDDYITGVKSDYTNEPELKYCTASITETPAPAVFTKNTTVETLNLLVSLPHGVLKMYTDSSKKGIVESSTNLAIVSVSNETPKILTINSSHRSSNDSSMDWVIAMHSAIAASNGVKHVLSDRYPSWDPNDASELLAVAKDVYADKIPGYTASIIHAGLETAYIVKKCPGTDCISIGPTIKNPHSSEESIRMDTVPQFYDIVKEIITRYYAK